MSEKQINIYKQSRKAFLVEYFCGFAILLMALTLPVKYSNFQFPLFILGGLSFGSAEFSRYLTRYIFTSDKIVVISGLIKQSKKHIYFHPLGFVPDLHVSQGRIQRIFDFGDIHLKSGGENNFMIKNISNPHKVYRLIESSIKKNRKLD